MDSSIDRFRAITEEMIDLYKRKNACYGDSFGRTFRELGIVSAITRISDKYHRLVELGARGGADSVGESLEDTLIDLANYSVMTLMEMRNGRSK